ncbi:helix-turn-helix protein [Haloactinospora alba]|uniref:Helix-turn-helix protein n=1 Tax=Haloactinospora alba TaxID=405555 RepID=A0A543NFH5_9ACTN|nr:helix-turn-helix transcriptional regulator [Haloactinospora alba]TQN30571.1 helix-turn-helix protein [Haloactinospora alba]
MKKPLTHDPEAVYIARKRAGMTQSQIADAVGCGISLICEIEGGTRNAGHERLERMAAAFGCSVADLRRDTEVRK